jgi:hypothetical protein
MCTGLEPLIASGVAKGGLAAALPGIIASAGGAFINNQIQNKAIEGQNRQNQIAMDMERTARENETERQRVFEDEQAQAVMQALQMANPETVAEDVTETAPDSEIAGSADEMMIPFLPGQNADGDVATSIGKIINSALKESRGLLKAQSELSAQGTAFGGISDAIARMAGDVSNIGSKRNASSRVADMETFIPAAKVTPSNSIIGDALMLAGQGLAGMAGKAAGSSGATFSPKLPLTAQRYGSTVY